MTKKDNSNNIVDQTILSFHSSMERGEVRAAAVCWLEHGSTLCLG